MGLCVVPWLAVCMAVLGSPPRTVKPLVPRTDPPLIHYTDASGQPQNGLGAVFIDGDSILWTGCRCPDPLISSLSDRATQINPLELCGVILGLWTFRELIRGRRVIIYIDNQAALGAIKKGRSSVPDFNELVFFARGICSSEMAEPVFFWVPSDLNWSDAPSRYTSPIDGFWIAPITGWRDLCKALAGKNEQGASASDVVLVPATPCLVPAFPPRSLPPPSSLREHSDLRISPDRPGSGRGIPHGRSVPVRSG